MFNRIKLLEFKSLLTASTNTKSLKKKIFSLCKALQKS